MDRLRGRLLDYERVGMGSRPLRLLEDDRVGLGGARCEFGWSVLDGVLAVTDVDGRPTFLAREGADGVWRGRWLEHERCEVVLTPLPRRPGARPGPACGTGRRPPPPAA